MKDLIYPFAGDIIKNGSWKKENQKKMIRKNKLLGLIFLILFYSSCAKSQEKGALKIIIKPVPSSSDSLFIDCFYINQTDSIMLLPIKYFEEYEVQRFYFKDANVKYIGSDNQFVHDQFDMDENAEIEIKENFFKNYCYLDKEDYFQLIPSDTLKLRYSLKFLQYGGIRKGGAYQVRVLLNVNNQFKETCPRMWVGEVQSELTLIKF